jgi:hypothetical protein
MVNNVIARLNNTDFGGISSEFTSIKVSINALQNELTISQRIESDKLVLANQSEASTDYWKLNRVDDKLIINLKKLKISHLKKLILKKKII